MKNQVNNTPLFMHICKNCKHKKIQMFVYTDLECKSCHNSKYIYAYPCTNRGEQIGILDKSNRISFIEETILPNNTYTATGRLKQNTPPAIQNIKPNLTPEQKQLSQEILKFMSTAKVY